MTAERLEMKKGKLLGLKSNQRFHWESFAGLVSALVGVFYSFSGGGSSASVAASEQTLIQSKQIQLVSMHRKSSFNWKHQSKHRQFAEQVILIFTICPTTACN